MSGPTNDDGPTVAAVAHLEDTKPESPDCQSVAHAEQALQLIDHERKAFEILRAAAACKGIALYELTNGEVLVCKWGLSRAVPIDALAAFLVPMGVRHA